MPGYVLRDWEVIDYQCHELSGTGLWFRGPAPEKLEAGGYFTAIGAAQTFGCFCDRPYPALLEKRLGMPALNLGYSGAGPGFFLRNDEMLRVINSSAFCIVQVMSGRSTSNSLLDNPEGLAYGRRRSDGTPATAEQVFDEAITRELARIPLMPRWAKNAILKKLGLPLPAVRRLVEEFAAGLARELSSAPQRRHYPHDPVLVFDADTGVPATLPPAGAALRKVSSTHRQLDTRSGEAVGRHLRRMRICTRQSAAACQPLYWRAHHGLA